MALIKRSMIKKLVTSISDPLLNFFNKKFRPTSIITDTFYIENSLESHEIDHAALDPGDSRIIASEHFTNPRIYRIAEGRVSTDHSQSDCFMTRANELINDITFSYVNGKRVSTDQNLIYKKYGSLKKPLHFDHILFSLLSGGGAQYNYYHWLFDALPRLKILELSPYQDQIEYYYIPDMKPHFKAATLNYFGIHGDKIIDSTNYPHITAQAIIATTHPNIPELGSVPLWICKFLQETFIKDLPKATDKRILISRKKATKRRIMNEDELFAHLEPLKFERVFLEELAFEEQVHLFNSSTVIISPHGAGLANLAFCQAGTKVLEIYPPNSYSYIYESIANTLKLEYLSYTGIAHKSAVEGDLHADFSVDIKQILQLMNLD